MDDLVLVQVLLCMEPGANNQRRSTWLSQILLFILQSLVLLQEISSEYLHRGLACLKVLLYSWFPRQKRPHPPQNRKVRGRKPAFPRTVAVIIAEDLPRRELLDRAANLVHWYTVSPTDQQCRQGSVSAFILLLWRQPRPLPWRAGQPPQVCSICSCATGRDAYERRLRCCEDNSIFRIGACTKWR